MTSHLMLYVIRSLLVGTWPADIDRSLALVHKWVSRSIDKSILKPSFLLGPMISLLFQSLHLVITELRYSPQPLIQSLWLWRLSGTVRRQRRWKLT